MADIVQSLFGVTPEMYQQSQQAQADAQALQYAKLSPFEQANYAIGRGATMLGGAIGRGLGGQDPELARITMRQQIAGQINFADPKSIFQGVELLRQANDTQGAMMLADAGRKAESERALAQQRTAEKMTTEERNARAYALSVAEAGTPQFNQLYQTTLAGLLSKEKPEPTTNEITNAKQIALTAGKEGSPEYIAKFNTELERLTTKGEKTEPKPEIQRLQEYAATLPVGSPLLAQVQAVIKAKSEPSGPKITNVLPGQPVPTKDWMDFNTKILSGDPVMQRTSTILSDAPSAIEIIRNSTSNDFAAASLPTSIALLTGQGKNMSNADVNRFARTGGLDDRLAQDAVKFFTGGTTQVKKDQAERFAVALYRGALIERKKKLQTAAEEFGYLTSPNYKFALKNIDDQLDQFKLVKKGESLPATTTQSDEELLKKYPPKEKN